MLWKNMKSKQKYFHGGVRNLKIGDYLLPPDDTKINWSNYAHCRSDRVYVTSKLYLAEVHAYLFPQGSLYQVEPIGRIAIDIDAPEVGWHCKKAKIISVLRKKVKSEPKNWQEH